MRIKQTPFFLEKNKIPLFFVNETLSPIFFQNKTPIFLAKRQTKKRNCKVKNMWVFFQFKRWYSPTLTDSRCDAATPPYLPLFLPRSKPSTAHQHTLQASAAPTGARAPSQPCHPRYVASSAPYAAISLCNTHFGGQLWKLSHVTITHNLSGFYRSCVRVREIITEV